MGAAAVLISRPFLPHSLSFAVAAKIFVALKAVAPGSQREGNTDLAIMSDREGFMIVMVRDVTPGKDKTEIFCGYFFKAGILSFTIQFILTGDNPC